MVVVAAGLLAGSNAVGDALYAVLVYVLVVGVAPAARSTRAGLVAFGICAAIELLQLTGVAAAIVDALPPAHYVLGTTFNAPDLAAYAVGVLVAGGLDALVRRRLVTPRAPARTPG